MASHEAIRATRKREEISSTLHKINDVLFELENILHEHISTIPSLTLNDGRVLSLTKTKIEEAMLWIRTHSAGQ